jgi:putative superfamily III holin-X
MSWLAGWLAELRSVNRAYLAVVRAEVDALSRDLAVSGRRLTGGVVLLLAAAAIALFLLGALVFTLIAIVAIWLPLWGAGLVVCGILLLATLVIGGIGWKRLRRLESPATTVRRRFDDHLAWWAGLGDEERRAMGEPAVEEYEEDLP